MDDELLLLLTLVLLLDELLTDVLLLDEDEELELLELLELLLVPDWDERLLLGLLLDEVSLANVEEELDELLELDDELTDVLLLELTDVLLLLLVSLATVLLLELLDDELETLVLLLLLVSLATVDDEDEEELDDGLLLDDVSLANVEEDEDDALLLLVSDAKVLELLELELLELDTDVLLLELLELDDSSSPSGSAEIGSEPIGPNASTRSLLRWPRRPVSLQIVGRGQRRQFGRHSRRQVAQRLAVRLERVLLLARTDLSELGGLLVRGVEASASLGADLGQHLGTGQRQVYYDGFFADPPTLAKSLVPSTLIVKRQIRHRYDTPFGVLGHSNALSGGGRQSLSGGVLLGPATTVLEPLDSSFGPFHQRLQLDQAVHLTLPAALLA